MRRLKSLRLQAEHGLLTCRFLVSVADGTVAEMKSAADTLNAFRIAHKSDLRDNYDTIYRIWWGETRYWRVYLERLSSP